jgi:outer membrane protein OmpA-like peptidoglycan-associated protein
MTSRSLTAFALSAAFVAGCGSALPPSELVVARESYANSAKGPAAQYRPDTLQDAKDSLDNAEHSFDKNGPSDGTKYLARVAALKAQQADSDGRTAIAKKEKEDLEKKYAQAVSDLKTIAAVKQEGRGMVITLSGEVLFASGESALLPGAMVKLNEVADALTKSNPESKIVVEGHTDSQGKAAFNQELSFKRAQSVRDYLAAHGIASDRISAQGLGSTRPIATNGNPEGRANNRRVEIIVQPAAP